MVADIKQFEGVWVGYRSENLDKFLDEAGMDPHQKAIALKEQPTQTFYLDGGIIRFTYKLGPNEIEYSFKLEEQTYIDMNILQGMAVTSFDSITGKMRAVVTPTDPNKKGMTIERAIVDDELMQRHTIGGVTVTRYYKRK